jgi:hypothetical protein
VWFLLVSDELKIRLEIQTFLSGCSDMISGWCQTIRQIVIGIIYDLKASSNKMSLLDIFAIFLLEIFDLNANQRQHDFCQAKNRYMD